MPSNKNSYSAKDLEEDQDIKVQRRHNYWRANTTLIKNLLLVWAFVSLGCSILFVPLLNRFDFGSVPLGFWMAQQGSIYIFVILTFIYAIKMDKLDRKYGKK